MSHKLSITACLATFLFISSLAFVFPKWAPANNTTKGAPSLATGTAAPSVETPISPTNSAGDISWRVEELVTLANQAGTPAVDGQGELERMKKEIQSYLKDDRVQWDVSIDSITAAASTYKITLSGDGGINQFRQTIFKDLNTPINLLGGPVALEINGSVVNGKSLAIVLESNPTTGNVWKVVHVDAGLLSINGQNAFTQKADQVGGTGVQTITLDAVGSGQTSMRLNYGRPWANDSTVTRWVTIKAGDSLNQTLDLSSPVTSPAITEKSVPQINPALNDQKGSLPAAFDWHAQGKLTPMRDQLNCNSCWAFSTVGVMEAAIKIQGGGDVDLSEQYLVSCNNSGFTCSVGGWWAHDYHISRFISPQTQAGAVLESDFPYTASDGVCSQPYTHPYKLTSWYSVAGDVVPSTNQIKNAIYNYGPVSAALCVSNAFASYTGGVFATDEAGDCGSHKINHAIVLTGWDDATQTWVLRNSWGTSWGENGYMRIKYGTSNVGYSANYVVYHPAGVTTTAQTPTPNPTPSATATPPAVINDSFEGATAITLTQNAYSLSENTANASKAADDPPLACLGASGNKTVWFKFTPNTSGTITVDTIGSNYDTVLGVYQGSQGSLTSRACNDDGGGRKTSKIKNLAVSQGQTYYIEVAGWLVYTKGALELHLQETPNATVTTSVTPAATANKTPVSYQTPTPTIILSMRNLASGKSASQSSTDNGAEAGRAIDGNTSGSLEDQSMAVTKAKLQSWWQVDLGASLPIRAIKIWNRTDGYANRLSGFYVFVSDQPFKFSNLYETFYQAGVDSTYFPGQAGTPSQINVNRSARYIRIQLASQDSLSLAEVQVLGK